MYFRSEFLESKVLSNNILPGFVELYQITLPVNKGFKDLGYTHQLWLGYFAYDFALV